MSEKMEALKQEAEELGIKVDGRWSEAKLQEAIDAKLTEEPAKEIPADGLVLKNVGKRKHMIAGKVVESGKVVELTEKQLKDEILMAKVKMSIKCGVLVEVE